MSLNQEISHLVAAGKSQLPPEIGTSLENLIIRLKKDFQGKEKLQVGKKIPSVSFTNADGKVVSIDKFYQSRPVVLIFYRGNWCPFCDLTLRAYNKHTSQFEKAGVNLVGVSPQKIEYSKETKAKAELNFELVSDIGNEAAQTFGIGCSLTPDEQKLYAQLDADLVHFNGDESWQLPAPSVILIDTDGTLLATWIDYDYTHRAEPEEVVQKIQQVLTNKV
jgi:peroxiredoxin